MTDKLGPEASREFARLALEAVKMKAKREFLEMIYKREKDSIEWMDKIFKDVGEDKNRLPEWARAIKDPGSFIAGARHTLAGLEQIINNENNWRY